MENNFFVTGKPNEFIATPNAKGGKLTDWNNGYGKQTVAVFFLLAAYNLYDTGFLVITLNNWLNVLFIYVRDVWFLLIAYYIYKGPFNKEKNLLIINTKGIFHNQKTFFWNDIISFQLLLERGINKRQYFYYLHITTKNQLNHKIDISMYNNKLQEILIALRKNVGKYAVKDLGFSQTI